MTACSSSHILFRVYTSDFKVASRLCGFSSHSQMVIKCHPISASFFSSSISRSWFLRIFASQNSLFVCGILQHSEFLILNSPFSICGNATLCPCQKHPFTKIHVRYFFSTRSGCPRQPWRIQPIPESPTPQPFTHNHLRLRILRMDRRHVLMPLFFRESSLLRCGHSYTFVLAVIYPQRYDISEENNRFHNRNPPKMFNICHYELESSPLIHHRITPSFRILLATSDQGLSM